MTIDEYEIKIYKLERAMWACSVKYEEIMGEIKKDEYNFIEAARSEQVYSSEYMYRYVIKIKNWSKEKQRCIDQYKDLRDESNYWLIKYEDKFGRDKSVEFQGHIDAIRCCWKIENDLKRTPLGIGKI